MSEVNTRPTLGDNVGWNTGGTGTETDPTAERAAGWANAQTPGHDEDNYMYARWGEMIQWIEANAPRRWDELAEAIGAASVDDIFYVVPPTASGISYRGASKFNTAGLGSGGAVSDVRCDGELVFYTQGVSSDELLAVNAADGQDGAGGSTYVWTATPSAGNALFALACDGVYVWYVSNGSNAGIWRRDRADGGNPTNNSTTRHSHSRLRSNGAHVCGINGSPGVGYVDVWTCAGPTLVGSTNTGSGGAGLLGLAIDQDTHYCGGVRNTDDVWAYVNSSAVLKWQVTLDTNAPTVRAIAADGDFVYVGTDDFATAAGPNKNLFCLDRTTGALLWSDRVGGAVNCLNLEVDDQYLYFEDSTNNMHMMRLHTSIPLGKVAATIANIGDDFDVDGASIYCRNSGTSGNLLRINTLDGPKRFYMPKLTSPTYRRPFYNVAIPVVGG